MKQLQGTLTENSIKALSEFLRRVDLKGSEVPAFNQVMVELQKFTVIESSKKVTVSPK